jgi:hypothetical protein
LFSESKAIFTSRFVNPSDVAHLDKAMDQLAAYQKRSIWQDDDAKILGEMKSIVVVQFKVVITNFKTWCSREPYDPSKSYDWEWLVLSPNDWLSIIDSMLLASSDVFAESFGRELVFLKQARELYEIFANKAGDICFLCDSGLMEEGDNSGKHSCPNCKWHFGSVLNPKDCPVHADKLLNTAGYCTECTRNYRRRPVSQRNLSSDEWEYNENIQFQGGSTCGYSLFTMPQFLSDPRHFGHVACTFGQVAGLLVTSKKQNSTSVNG